MSAGSTVNHPGSSALDSPNVGLVRPAERTVRAVRVLSFHWRTLPNLAREILFRETGHAIVNCTDGRGARFRGDLTVELVEKGIKRTGPAVATPVDSLCGACALRR